jgi:hypothetical protein
VAERRDRPSLVQHNDIHAARVTRTGFVCGGRVQTDQAYSHHRRQTNTRQPLTNLFTGASRAISGTNIRSM